MYLLVSDMLQPWSINQRNNKKMNNILAFRRFPLTQSLDMCNVDLSEMIVTIIVPVIKLQNQPVNCKVVKTCYKLTHSPRSRRIYFTTHNPRFYDIGVHCIKRK